MPSQKTIFTRLLAGGSLVVAGMALPFLLSGCEKPATPSEPVPMPVVPAPVAPSAPSGIQPGEKLDVFVMEDESFAGSYTVRSTGDIILPQVGRIKVQGLSAANAEKLVSQELEKDKLTNATVLVDRVDLSKKPAEPEKTAGTDVFLSGKVNRPGRYSIAAVGNSLPTVHQAILQAGGCSRFAHKRKAHVLRKLEDGRLRRIDADLIAIESGLAKDVPLASGDIIVVPEKKVDFGL